MKVFTYKCLCNQGFLNTTTPMLEMATLPVKMKCHPVVLIVIFLSVLSLVKSESESELPRRNYCGRELAIALDYVCNGNLIKRSMVAQNDVEYGWPWIPPQKARGLNMDKRQNVVSECCHKACTTNELMTYCGD